METKLLNNHGWLAQPLGLQYLPDELVEEIISRLPVRSVIQFKSVCKSWYNIISSEDFTILHLNNYKPPSNLLVSGSSFISLVAGISRRCYRAEAESLPIMSSIANYPPCPFNQFSYPRVSGPCNGIFCLYGWHVGTNLVLWNPAIKDFKIIRQSIKLSRPNYDCIYSVGFCFDPQTNDYKILQILLDKAHDYHHHLYSLRTNSWRKLDYYTQRNPNVFNIHYDSRQLTANTKIVCRALDLKSEQYHIRLFDVSSEKFDMIPISLEGHIPTTEGYRQYVFLFRESIALVIYRNARNSHGCFEIWVLNDLSCNPQSRSWSKLSTFVHIGLHRPLGLWETSCLFFQHRFTKNLILYDFILNRDVVDIGLDDVPNNSICLALVYKESLVSISNKEIV